MSSSFATLLVQIFQFISKSFFKNALKSLGVGLVTYTLMMVFYNTALAYLHSSLGSLGEFFYAFNLAGIDEFLSKITSAISIRMYIVSKKISFRSLS
jgi:hypothetical protein